MPELPEVETVLRGLKDRALGRRITAVIVGHPGVVIGSPEDFATRLEGKSLRACAAREKPWPSNSASWMANRRFTS